MSQVIWTVRNVKTKTDHYNQSKSTFLMTSTPSQFAMFSKANIGERLPLLSNLQETVKRLLIRRCAEIQKYIIFPSEFFVYSFDIDWTSCILDMLKQYKDCHGPTES